MGALFRDIDFVRLIRRVLTGGVAVYVAVSLTLGGTRAARPVFQGLLAGWVLLLVLVQYRLRARHSKEHGADAPRPSGGGTLFRRLELIAFNLALTLVMAEFALRAFAAWGGTSLFLSDALEAHLLAPGRDYGGGLRGNALGYPGPDFQEGKRPGVFRIAALGDSFAVGPAVPFAENYLTLLAEKMPGVEVYNFGVSGAGPREYQAVLERDGWRHRPDLVLLSVFVGNDVSESLPVPRAMDPRQHSLYLLLTRGGRLAREEWRQPAGPSANSPERLPPRGLAPQTFREVEARRLAVCLKRPPGSLGRKWRRALAHLDNIVAGCRRRGVPLAVVLIPDEFQVNPAVLTEALTEAGLTRQDLDLDLPQRRLAGFFAERGTPCLDLLPPFRGHTDTYAVRDTHWNVRGNRLAAERIAAWLWETVRK
jgi:hypothetical protein